ncbi:MAG TPA: phosphoribosyltransferase family protein [Thermoanaerobaculia bacterium]|nr:phosphoribosyltransferase family protein [Thermoanaerobaculia bacterium]
MTAPSYDGAARSVAPLLHLLLPACCLGCGAPLPVRAPLGLCVPCRGRLAPLPATRCAACARRLDAFALPAGFRCGRCRERPPAWDRLLAGWSYEPPLDAVVRGLKFGRLDYLGEHLAAALAAALAEELAATLPPGALVTAVPLHWRRRLARGYNQAERITRPLAARLGLPCRALLRRRRATPPQSGLPRGERLANLRRAFAPRWGATAAVRGRSILLVDDVATTGATLEAAAAALKTAGAAAVIACVAARTPEGS